MASVEDSPKTQLDFAERTVDTIDSVVTTIREKTVDPLVKLTRIVVYGILVLIALVLVAVLGSIALVRLLDVYAFGNRVWISYFIIGGIFTIVGLLLWSKRTKH